MIKANLIVAAEPARLVKPTKGSLHNPAFRQNFESFGSVTAAHNFQSQLAERAKLLNPLNQGPQVATIGPNELHASVHSDQNLDQALGGIAVLYGSGRDHNRQNQAQAVHGHVAFAPRHLFARVVATRSRLIGRLNRLAVNDGGGRRDLSCLGLAQPVPQGVVNKPPGPVPGPLAKVAIDRLPRTEILGQQTPGASGANDVEDSVDQAAALQRDGSSALSFSGFRSRNKRFDVVPFLISQVCWVVSWMRLHPLHL